MPRDVSIAHLHPDFRARVSRLASGLSQTPFQLFEGFRSPERQRDLFRQGRGDGRRIVTNADAWQSYHQYGLAADFVLLIDGVWSWSSDAGLDAHWKLLRKLAGQAGLECLSWEAPHVQFPGLSWRGLMKGEYPSGGDATWAEHLQESIQRWKRSGQAAPPVPSEVPHRPAIQAAEAHSGNGTSDRASGTYSRVAARHGLRLRSGPGVHFNVVDVLPLGRQVSVMRVDGEWVAVDLNFDGYADGYCHAGYLEPIAA
ncbi:M15 family metallopeptidase [Lysobacter auxotrophicus]|uniref:SH3b domain-containing protein n=1 Tax=Lysobacter auxotrophicus TaxID=2992573 RepID=A0ABM8DEE3_9GAMM|nr:M15 family metallopeptidase [Lysobacter auxotrophicus]BDU16917.1 hypothetical protein LA521A_21180 [Lysobacter auxotrophicus]